MQTNTETPALSASDRARETARDMRAKLHEKAAQIATLLPGEWTADKDGTTEDDFGGYRDIAAYLTRTTDGATLSLKSFTENTSAATSGKTRVWAGTGKTLHPYTNYREGQKQEIYCKSEKTPEQMAADITRRLLPTLDEMTTAAQARKTEAEQRDDTVGEVTAAIIKASGGTYKTNDREREKRGDTDKPRWEQFIDTGSYRKTIKVSQSEVYIELRLDPEEALKLVAFLATI